MSTGETLEVLGPVLVPQYKRDTELQSESNKGYQGLEHRLFVKKPRELGLFSVKRRRLGWVLLLLVTTLKRCSRLWMMD